MYDDVFVNQEIVKKDYAVGCTGKLKTEYDELIAKIKKSFQMNMIFIVTRTILLANTMITTL